jgi:hypothetical protein
MARTEAVVQPRNDAYTGLLAISFLALVGASVMMYLDAESLGKAPPPLKLPDVPGTTAGPKGAGLERPAIAPAPGPGVPAPDAKGGMGKAEPRALPPLPTDVAAAPAPAAVVPVKAQTTPTDPDAPPLPPPAFVPPGN